MSRTNKIRRIQEFDSVHMAMARGVDRISDLSDDLLHRILARLPSLAAAAQTSLLSRRWRRVWTGLLSLAFGGGAGASTPDAVDAALSACSAPWLRRLAITTFAVPVDRANAWLRFASQRLAGELLLHLSILTVPRTMGRKPRTVPRTMCRKPRTMDRNAHELELPVCERVTTMDIFITKPHDVSQMCPDPLLRLLGPGTFTALRVLKIRNANLVCEDLWRVVSEQSPCLQELELHSVHCVHDLNIHSGSLERIELWYLEDAMDRLDIVAPRLLYLQLKWCWAGSISIAAPALSELIWDCSYNGLCASSTNITVADRHLARLETRCFRSNAALFQQFDTVDQLCLYIWSFSSDMDLYNFLMKDTDKLPRPKILQVEGLRANNHGFAAMLHLLRKCDGLRLKKLKISMWNMDSRDNHICTPTCMCASMESWRTNEITLGSLQEIEIDYFNGDDHFCAFLELLFIRCNISPERLVIYPSGTKPLTMWIRERIETLAYPCTNIEFPDPIPCSFSIWD